MSRKILASGPWWEVRAAKKSGEETRAEVLIYGDIGESWWGDSVTAKDLVEQLNAIEADVIDVRINSYGGSVTDGIAIINALKRHKARVETHIDGIAASMGSGIAMAGERIVMADNAMMMIHAPWVYADGNAMRLREVADILDKWGEQLIKTYQSHASGENAAIVEGWMKDGQDHWLDAAEALELGLITEIGEGLAAAASLDLSRYKNLPEAAQRFAHRDRTQPAATAAKPEKPSSAKVTERTQPGGEATMDPKDTTPTKPADGAPQADVVDLDAVRKDAEAKAIKAERERVTAIREACAKAAIDSAEADKMIADGTDADKARAKVLDLLAAKSEETGVSGVNRSAASVGATGLDRAAEDARVAILARVAPKDHKVERTNPMRGKDLLGVMAEVLRASGQRIDGLTRDELALRVLAAHTTSDFPNILEDVTNKILRGAYDGTPRTFVELAQQRNLRDFKPAKSVKLGDVSSLEKIEENGEYTYGTVGDTGETWSLSTFGKVIALTRRALVDDDLSAFDQLPMAMGAAAADRQSDTFWDLLASNPTMSDSVAFFNSAHGNLANAADNIDVDGVGLVTKALREQTNEAGRPIGIQPTHLIVGPTKEQQALQFLAGVFQPTSQSAAIVQGWRNLTLIVEPRITDAAWYVAAVTPRAPFAEYGFLEGASQPYIESRVNWDTDALEMKVRLDFGCGLIDWRSIYKVPA